MGVQRITVSGLGVGVPSSGSTPSSIALIQKYLNWEGGTGLTLQLNFSGGGPASATVSVQVSCDPLAGPTNSLAVQNTARWNNHSVLVNQTADALNSIVYPIYYLRLNCTAYASGTVTLDVTQVDQL